MTRRSVPQPHRTRLLAVLVSCMLLMAAGLCQATQPHAAAPEPQSPPAAGSAQLPIDVPPARPSGTPPAPFIPAQSTARPSATTDKTNKAEKEADKSKETNKVEGDETKKNPSELVGIINALAWPVALLLIVVVLLVSLVVSGTVRSLFGITMSMVRKIKIPGLELEIDPGKIGQFKEAVAESFDELVKKAEPLYREMVSSLLVSLHLSRVMRSALPQVLRNRNLNENLPGLRATIHVPDIVVNDYLYQLVPYFPRPGAGGPVGRRFSQRYGIIGRAWRLQRSMGQGQAVAGPNAANQLIELWGMTADEAANSSRLSPAILCIVLRDPDAADVPIGLLYIDSTQPDAFSPFADDVAQELENQQLTRGLGTAVASAMRPLRLGPPGLEISS